MTRSPAYLWSAAVLLWVGVFGATGVMPQRRMELAAPLAEAIPLVIDGYSGIDVEISAEEQSVAGFTDYILRNYELPVAGEEAGAQARRIGAFTVYVGYYAGQTQGETIHSPKNCLPGAGWETLDAKLASIETPRGTVDVNRYFLQNGDERALVLYWYQGRGRIQANEYVVKWDLLRDAALRQRSDEALVRIVVPVWESEEDPFDLARSVAEELVPVLDRALPS